MKKRNYEHVVHINRFDLLVFMLNNNLYLNHNISGNNSLKIIVQTSQGDLLAKLTSYRKDNLSVKVKTKTS